VQVNSLTGIIAVEGGGFHSLFLKNDGTVWACGDNSNGQLGDGTVTDRHTPVQVNLLAGFIAVAGGQFYSLFLKNDGTVWACGSNNNGQIGDSTTTDRWTPVQVTGLCIVPTFVAEQQQDPSADGLIYPNPTSGTFQIQKGNMQNAIGNLEIYNLMGEKVKVLSLTPNPSPQREGSASIDVSELAPGIYFVKVRGEKEVRVMKFVKL
jgi:hypothetical protein